MPPPAHAWQSGLLTHATRAHPGTNALHTQHTRSCSLSKRGHDHLTIQWQTRRAHSHALTHRKRAAHNTLHATRDSLLQSLQNKDMTIYGDGSQTRSFQYVDDLVNGLVMLMNSDYRECTTLHTTTYIFIYIHVVTRLRLTVFHVSVYTTVCMVMCMWTT
jgi:NAD dependent epimerase/dehydratase family